MARRKAPQIADEVLDQLLSGTAASAAFDQGGLLDQLKKALAERALNAEMEPAVLRMAAGHPQPAAVQGADRLPDRPGAHHHHGRGFLPVPPHHGAAQSRQAMRRTTQQRR